MASRGNRRQSRLNGAFILGIPGSNVVHSAAAAVGSSIVGTDKDHRVPFGSREGKKI